MKDDYKVFKTSLFLALIPWVLVIFFNFTLTTNITKLNNKIDTYLKENNLNKEEISRSILDVNTNDDKVIILTDLSNLQEYTLYYSSEQDKLLNKTNEVNQVKNLLTQDTDFDFVKKIYSTNKNINDTKLFVTLHSESFIKNIQDLVDINGKQKEHIQSIQLDFLYEDDSDKKIVENKYIIYVNNKLLLNEIIDYQEIDAVVKNLNLEGNLKPIAFIPNDNKKLFIYFYRNNLFYTYIENKNITEPDKVNNNIKNIVTNYLQS